MKCSKCGYDGVCIPTINEEGRTTYYCPKCGNSFEGTNESTVNKSRSNSSVKTNKENINYDVQYNKTVISNKYVSTPVSIQEIIFKLQTANIVVLIIALITYIFIPVMKIGDISLGLMDYLGNGSSLTIFIICLLLALSFQIHEMSSHNPVRGVEIFLLVISCFFFLLFMNGAKDGFIVDEKITSLLFVSIVILICVIISLVLNIVIYIKSDSY